MYGYKPENHKFIDNLGNLYLCSNTPCYLTGCEPCKPEEFHKLMCSIYVDNNYTDPLTEY